MNQMNQNIPFYLIESFVVAAHGPSFEEAAKKLGLTQSALSRQMQSFEEYLPQKIFTLDGRRKVLTKYGQTLFELLAPEVEKAQRLVHLAGLIHQDISSSHVKICGRGELLEGVAINSKFKGKISFCPMDGDKALREVLDRKCDIGIVSRGVNSSELIMKPYFSNRLKLVIPKKLISIKGNSKEEIFEKLHRIPCILYKIEDSVVAEFLSQFNINFQKLNVARIFPHYRSIQLMLEKNLGWAVIPTHIELDLDRYLIYELTHKSKDMRDYSLCYRRELKDSPWFKDLLNELLKIQ